MSSGIFDPFEADGYARGLRKGPVRAPVPTGDGARQHPAPDTGRARGAWLLASMLGVVFVLASYIVYLEAM